MAIYDKLSVINTNLLRTGNNTAAQEGEGTPEWIIGSDSYDKRLAEVIYAHDWGFSTSSAPLVRIGPSSDPRFTDVYAKPIGCLHVVAVWLNGQDLDYIIMDNAIHCVANTTAPTAKFLQVPSADRWPPAFVSVLDKLIMSDIYRGLNQDPVEADKAESAAYRLLDTARARSDSEAPPRAYTNSRMLAGRRLRRGGTAFQQDRGR